MKSNNAQDRSTEFPLFPELPEAAKEEAQELVDKFKLALEKAAKDVLSTLYTDVAVHIESDSWTNFRNELMEGFKNYDNRKIQSEYDFKEIRQAILKEHRADIINDLNQDLVKENEDLKKRVEQLEQDRRDYFNR